jgi:hypothetical protein
VFKLDTLSGIGVPLDLEYAPGRVYQMIPIQITQITILGIFSQIKERRLKMEQISHYRPLPSDDNRGQQEQLKSITTCLY